MVRKQTLEQVVDVVVHSAARHPGAGRRELLGDLGRGRKAFGTGVATQRSQHRHMTRLRVQREAAEARREGGAGSKRLVHDGGFVPEDGHHVARTLSRESDQCEFERHHDADAAGADHEALIGVLEVPNHEVGTRGEVVETPMIIVNREYAEGPVPGVSRELHINGATLARTRTESKAVAGGQVPRGVPGAACGCRCLDRQDGSVRWLGPSARFRLAHELPDGCRHRVDPHRASPITLPNRPLDRTMGIGLATSTARTVDLPLRWRSPVPEEEPVEQTRLLPSKP